MRRRSNTIQADSVEEYIDKALKIQAEEDFKENNYSSFYYTVRSVKQINNRKFFSEHSLPGLLTLIPDDDSSENDSNNSDKSPSVLAHMRLNNPLYYATPYKQIRREIGIKCHCPPSNRVNNIMIIGDKGTGRSCLIKSIFDDYYEHDESENPRTFKMQTRCHLHGPKTEEFQIWTHDNDIELNNPIKIEENKIRIFIFVYSLANKKSFESLERSIKEVRSKVEKHKFVGFLVATFSDIREKREVPPELGTNLKTRYSLHGYLETYKYDEKLKRRFLSVMKLTM